MWFVRKCLPVGSELVQVDAGEDLFDSGWGGTAGSAAVVLNRETKCSRVGLSSL